MSDHLITFLTLVAAVVTAGIALATVYYAAKALKSGDKSFETLKATLIALKAISENASATAALQKEAAALQREALSKAVEANNFERKMSQVRVCREIKETLLTITRIPLQLPLSEESSFEEQNQQDQIFYEDRQRLIVLTGLLPQLSLPKTRLVQDLDSVPTSGNLLKGAVFEVTTAYEKLLQDLDETTPLLNPPD